MGKRNCRAKTREGKLCRNQALVDSPFCTVHAENTRGPIVLNGIIDSEEVVRPQVLMADPHVDDAMIVLAYALRQAISEGANSAEILHACDAYVKTLAARKNSLGRQSSLWSRPLKQLLMLSLWKLASIHKPSGSIWL